MARFDPQLLAPVEEFGAAFQNQPTLTVVSCLKCALRSHNEKTTAPSIIAEPILAQGRPKSSSVRLSKSA